MRSADMNNVAQINPSIVYEPSQTTHWKHLFPNKTMLLGSHNLNEGEELVAKIAHVETQNIRDDSGQQKEVPVITFEDAPPMVMNITNVKTIASLYGVNYYDWKGQSIQIYATLIKAFGKEGMALRVRATIPETKEDKSLLELHGNKLSQCTTISELKKVFTEIPKHIKVRLTEYKDTMKNQIGETNV